MKKKKNVWLAAILNLLLPGLGYIYTGRRVVFVSTIILLSIFYVSATLDADMTTIDWLVGIPLSLLFAYDGYKTAEEANEKK